MGLHRQMIYEAHHKALTDDINTNHQRLGNPMVVFESAINDILAGLSSIVFKKGECHLMVRLTFVYPYILFILKFPTVLSHHTASDPQEIDLSTNMGMADVNVQALHITSQAMRDMVKVNSILGENLDSLLAAIKRKHDKEIQTWQYITGGLVVVAYAGGCWLCPGLAIYAWVTGGFATSAVAVAGVAGAASTGYGGQRWWNEEVQKVKERQEKGTSLSTMLRSNPYVC